MVLRPPMKISEVYSSMARLLSATYGTYLMTTTWSGCSPGLYSIELLATMSSTTLDLLISYFTRKAGSLRGHVTPPIRSMQEAHTAGLCTVSRRGNRPCDSSAGPRMHAS